MTNYPISNLIRERIKELKGLNGDTTLYNVSIYELEKLSYEIESIEYQSVENMMEEMPEMTSILKRQEGYYQAAILDNLTLSPIGGRGVNIGEGNTPSEALKELKKKLNQ